MILWFRHNDGKGCYLNDFYLSRKYSEQQKDEGPDDEEYECGFCQKKQGEELPVGGTVNLMICSRCKKVYYCSREC